MKKRDLLFAGIACSSLLTMLFSSRRSVLGTPFCYMELPSGGTLNLEEICDMEGSQSVPERQGLNLEDFEVLLNTELPPNYPSGFPGQLPTEEDRRFVMKYFEAHGIPENTDESSFMIYGYSVPLENP